MPPVGLACNVTELPWHNCNEAGVIVGTTDAIVSLAPFEVTFEPQALETTTTVYIPESTTVIFTLEYVELVAEGINTPSLYHW